MKISEFCVKNFRSVHDSGWIKITQITSFVGPNESGKSNLCEALYLLNPFDETEKYDVNEDWPADDWGGRNENAVVCWARFKLEPDEIASLAEELRPSDAPAHGEEGAEEQGESSSAQQPLPSEVILTASRGYADTRHYEVTGFESVDHDALAKWANECLPRCVYIRDYEFSGAQVELDQLAQRNTQPQTLTREDKMILIILDLARIELADFMQKGATPAGRTLRTFDKIQASAYLTRQFARLWKQKKVRFVIDVDATTLNIFVEDEGLGMVVRLHRRSTGFRWYVSFAWKFTHATRGEYSDCILLLEEPGIHLHHAGHRDLLQLFAELSDKNTILYTTHLSTMIDPGFPERVRIVEVHDHHTTVLTGLVSPQPQPMMVIEASLGLTGSMSGLLGNRRTVVVEGGEDALILHKLSSVLERSDKEGLSEQIYLWPAKGAPNTPMYAGFIVGNRWNGAVLLDSDEEGERARDKINELYLGALADGTNFEVLMLAESAGIARTPAAIEELFPEDFYLGCINRAYGLALTDTDLPGEGTIKNRVKRALKTNHNREFDPEAVLAELLKQFDTWDDVKGLPDGTAKKAEKLFKAINKVFD